MTKTIENLEEYSKLQFMRQMYYDNLREREEWNQPLLVYEQYIEENKAFLEAEWLTK